MKTDERLIARALRREHGLSVREIAAAVGGARSTASLWLRDVPLTQQQRTALLERNRAYSAWPELIAKECDEDPDHLGVGVREPHLVTILVTLSPTGDRGILARRCWCPEEVPKEDDAQRLFTAQ